MDFGSVMNQVRLGGEGAGVPRPPGRGGAAGGVTSPGGGGHAWYPSGDGVCVEGACCPRVGGSAAVCHQRGSRGAGGLEESDAVLAGSRTWAGGEGRFAAGRDL